MGSCCDNKKNKIDYLFWSTFIISISAFLLYVIKPVFLENFPKVLEFSSHVHMILSEMWWGLLLGIFFVGLIGLIPRDVVISVLGKEKGIKSLFKAAFAGLLLDLCSHGILLVGMKLYERGARLSQLMAFLIASPWNSLSLTVILIALIGFKWTLIYILLSLVIAIISGIITQFFEDRGVLPANPHRIELDDNHSVIESLKQEFKGRKPQDVINFKFFLNSFVESEMIMKWIFVGVVAAGLIRTFVPTEIFATYFGPTMLGLWLTLAAATIIEVCSEGSVPIAYDIFTRAAAPGNAFLFLMVGVSTDYTEIMALKETTKSWKVALFLPLVTTPQIIVISYLLNVISVQ